MFFFKQKTAYELRISDWSSDVCSSDLVGRGAAHGQDQQGAVPAALARRAGTPDPAPVHRRYAGTDDRRPAHPRPAAPAPPWHRLHRRRLSPALAGQLARSEEHTSELQSLMRISYAVFCLKKNITQ